MSNDDVFFLNRATREPPLDDKRLQQYLEPPAPTGYKSILIKADVYRRFVENYEAMMAFITEVIPHLGLDMGEDVDLTRPLIENMTEVLKAHNQRKKKDEEG